MGGGGGKKGGEKIGGGGGREGRMKRKKMTPRSRTLIGRLPSGGTGEVDGVHDDGLVGSLLYGVDVERRQASVRVFEVGRGIRPDRNSLAGGRSRFAGGLTENKLPANFTQPTFHLGDKDPPFFIEFF